MSDQPSLIFIPGAWHQPTCYTKIVKLLQEQHEFRCITITLPSTRGDPTATFKDDLDAARSAISTETSLGRDVVVIAHSYGGMVGNSAIRGFTGRKSNASSTTSTEAQTTGSVVGLILIASGFTFTGFSFMDPFFGIPPPSWRVNQETGFADLVTPPRELFYHDVPADEVENWTAQLTPQSLKALFEGGEHAYAGWQDVPAWYLGTIEDRGLPVVLQRMSVGMARAMGGVVEHKELRSSHSPFLSQPGEVVQIIAEAVAAFTGKAPNKSDVRNQQLNEIAVPETKIWQPSTWFSYGIPLVLGTIIGKGVSAFGWCRRLWISCFH